MAKKFWICNKVSLTKAEILMYGYIGEYEEINDAEFISDLRQLESLYQNIDIRINCGGGDVHKGITIFNAIKNSKANIECYVDGIAASMGAIIVAACDKSHMSKYARYMTHRVRGGAFGDAEKLRAFSNELEALEDILANVLAEKTGLPAAEAKTKYLFNQDRWIGAQQALEEKLIDSIYDADEVAVPEAATEETMFNAYQQTFTNRFSNKPVYNMKEIAKALGLPEDATEADIKAAIEKNNKAQKAAEDALVANNKAKAKSLVAAAFGSGKITQAEVETYEAQAEKDYDFVAAVFNKLQPVKKPTEIINRRTGNEAAAQGEASGWEALLKKGSQAVNDMKQNDFAGYKKLWEDYYGSDYPDNEK